MSSDPHLRRIALMLSLLALAVLSGVAAGVALTRSANDDATRRASSPRVAPSVQPRPDPQVVEPRAGSVDSAGAVDRAPAPPGRRARVRYDVRKLVGQRIMTGMRGVHPSPTLLRRVRNGQVAGVILFSENVSGSLAGAIAQLQAAAAAGGNPPLLVAIDQEGGTVKRLPGAPPWQAPAQMTPAEARAQGAATGSVLAELGINTNLAPVADVSSGGFLGSRSFGSSAAHVASAACAFAAGLHQAGIHATFKHFPGLGRSAHNTDLEPVTLDIAASAIWRDLLPYRRCAEIPALVMVSNATYPALGGAQPAVFTAAVVQDLLRERVGFEGATISDSLAAPGVASSSTAIRAARAGVDILLYTDPDVSHLAYRSLLRAARAGLLSRGAVEASARRVRALRRQ